MQRGLRQDPTEPLPTAIMNKPALLFALASLGCATSEPTAPSPSVEWTWPLWREALLAGGHVGELPPIPAEGWSHECQRHCGEHPHSWVRPGAQLADYNSDGRLDYLRIQDPPGSYIHLVWVDHDGDGFFDRIPGVNEEDITDIRSHVSVPEFEPARRFHQSSNIEQ